MRGSLEAPSQRFNPNIQTKPLRGRWIPDRRRAVAANTMWPLECPLQRRVRALLGALLVAALTARVGGSARAHLRKIAFLKTHKTGGSTITSILHRLGMNYGLRQPIPEKFGEDHLFALWGGVGAWRSWKDKGQDRKHTSSFRGTVNLSTQGPPYDVWWVRPMHTPAAPSLRCPTPRHVASHFLVS